MIKKIITKFKNLLNKKSSLYFNNSKPFKYKILIYRVTEDGESYLLKELSGNGTPPEYYCIDGYSSDFYIMFNSYFNKINEFNLLEFTDTVDHYESVVKFGEIVQLHNKYNITIYSNID